MVSVRPSLQTAYSLRSAKRRPPLYVGSGTASFTLDVSDKGRIVARQGRNVPLMGQKANAKPPKQGRTAFALPDFALDVSDKGRNVAR
jgi:hypothetical protein